jgi:PEP-CTERM motif
MRGGTSFLFLAMIASPALAQAGTPIPEPTDLALFALGVVGLIIGRRSSRRPPQDRDEP